MKWKFRNILTATAVLLHGSIMIHAQEIMIPERWADKIRHARPLYPDDTVSICFLGDVMMHESQIRKGMKENGSHDFSTYFSLVEDRIINADIAVANMEFALGGEPYSGYPAFSAPDEIAHQAAESGIDVFLAANNHIYDKGSYGAERTASIYRELGKIHGIGFTGLASDEEEKHSIWPLRISAKGIRFAFVNFTYATNGGSVKGWPAVMYMHDRETIENAISIAKESHSDITVILPHWGNEYELHHSAVQQETARWLADNGADLIVGSHPHVVQDMEVLDGNDGSVPVVYSLGNAISNMSAVNTQIGLIAIAEFVRKGDGSVEMLPMKFTYTWCSRPGGFNEDYIIIPIEDYIDKKHLWQNRADYENMKASYKRVADAVGIKDTQKTDEQ